MLHKMAICHNNAVARCDKCHVNSIAGSVAIRYCLVYISKTKWQYVTIMLLLDVMNAMLMPLLGVTIRHCLVNVTHEKANLCMSQ